MQIMLMKCLCTQVTPMRGFVQRHSQWKVRRRDRYRVLTVWFRFPYKRLCALRVPCSGHSNQRLEIPTDCSPERESANYINWRHQCWSWYRSEAHHAKGSEMTNGQCGGRYGPGGQIDPNQISLCCVITREPTRVGVAASCGTSLMSLEGDAWLGFYGDGSGQGPGEIRCSVMCKTGDRVTCEILSCQYCWLEGTARRLRCLLAWTYSGLLSTKYIPE
jgi:hypothetical protein